MADIAIPRRSLLASLLAALAMFGPFCIDAIFPAFPAIAAQFNADAPTMQQTISVYLVVYALMSLLLGALSDAWGRRSVTLGCVCVFWWHRSVAPWRNQCRCCSCSAVCRAPVRVWG